MLIIDGQEHDGEEGVALLADGLRRGGLTSLLYLMRYNLQIGPQGAQPRWPPPSPSGRCPH